MTISQLTNELIQFSNDLTKQAEIKSQMQISEEQYLEKKVPTPTSKSEHVQSKSPKGRFKKTGIALLIFSIIGVVLLFNVISSYAKFGSLNGVVDDPGEEYSAWLDSFGDVESFDELEEGWKTVEDAWEKRGVHVDWEYVLEIRDGFGDTIRSDYFSSSLLKSLRYDADDINTKAATMLTFLIVVLIFAIVCARRFKRYHNEWKKEMTVYKQNVRVAKENKTFNEVQLPKLLAAREEKLPALREEYAKLMEALKKELAEVTESVAKRSHLLPEYYHGRAHDIAIIFSRGRASSVKEAINVLEEDDRAEELARIERARAAAEERARREEERRRSEAEAAARKEADAAKKQAAETLKAKQDMARSHCAKCANNPLYCDARKRNRIIEAGLICTERKLK